MKNTLEEVLIKILKNKVVNDVKDILIRIGRMEKSLVFMDNENYLTFKIFDDTNITEVKFKKETKFFMPQIVGQKLN